MTTALADVRAEFPILKSKTYLASHSLGAVPRATEAALAECYREWSTRGIQAWEGPWWETVLDFSRSVEALLHAPAGTVVPLPNATRGMAAAASCLDYRGGRNRIVMTDIEFTTFYPFWHGQEALGAQVVLVESADGVSVEPERIAAAIDDRTALVATCHAYFRSSAVQDLGPIVKAAHDHGALALGDGYQIVGAAPVDVQRLGVDFYVGGSHKYLCGGAGAGYLYVRQQLLEDLSPKLTGWFGLAHPFAYERVERSPVLNAGVYKFLDGTIAIPALYGAREGLRTVRRIGPEAIRKHSLGLTERVIKEADARGLQVRTPREPERRSGMVCIDFDGAKAVTDRLVAQGIIVDHRPDCGLRLSPHFYNAGEDLDRFFEALDAARRGANGAGARSRERNA